MDNKANLILRVGVAFAFLYPALDAIIDPNAWVGYLPGWLALAPRVVELHTFGAVEIIIALWLVWGRRILTPASAAVIILFAIVISDTADFQIVFRDVAIAAAALALAVDAYRPRNS